MAFMRDGGGTVQSAKAAPAPSSVLASLARDILAAAIATRATEASLLRSQASLLAWLAEGSRVRACGFESLYDLAREVLGIRPRTVRERLAMHRVLLRHPSMEQALLNGKVTACQVLAVAPLLDDADQAGGSASTGDVADASVHTAAAGAPTRSADDSVDWATIVAPLSVREIRLQAREIQKRRALEKKSRRRAVSPEEPEGRTISFMAPIPFRIVFDEMIELSRKIIGCDAPVHECIEAMLLETHWLGVGPQEEPPKVAEQRSIRVRPRDDVPHRPEAIAHARETVEQVRAYMKDVEDLIESGEPTSPHDAVFRPAGRSTSCGRPSGCSSRGCCATCAARRRWTSWAIAPWRSWSRTACASPSARRATGWRSRSCSKPTRRSRGPTARGRSRSCRRT